MMLAGTQSGKTCFGPHWLHREIREKGPGDYLAVTATFPLLNLKMLPEFLTVFRDMFHLGEYKDSIKTFEFDKNGQLDMFGAVSETPTRVIFASATNPESIESATAKGAWLDEAGQKQFRRDAWEAVRRRLSLSEGRCLFTTTLYCLGWLKSDLYDKAKAGDPDIEIVQFESTMNPAFPQREFEKAKSTMPPWKFDLFYRGRYSKPAGMIYDSFNEKICKIPRRNIPKDWPRYQGVDFGGVNTAAVWYAQNPATGEFFAYREYLAGGHTADHVKNFRELELEDTEVIWKRCGGSHQEEGWRDGFIACGLHISEPSIRGVENQIDKVFALHKQNKLFVFDDLEGYLDEKLSFSRELDGNYEPTEKIENEERYHRMSAERYILSDFDPQSVEGAEGELIHVKQW